MAAVNKVDSLALKVSNNAMIEEKNAVKSNFDKKLYEFYASHAKTDHNVKKPWSSERISQVIQQIKESRATMQKKSMDYYWLSKYDIMEIGDEEFLIFKKKFINDPTIPIIPMEKYFEILTEVHETIGHCGRLKMNKHIKNKFYIPKKAIEIFVDSCSVCEMKRSMSKKWTETKPIISKDFNTRGQIDLVDLQSAPDGEYKWLMNYQDHTTKFVHLRPLKTKKAAEIARELLKIFLEFGTPSVLQSNNGRKFTAHVIEELVSMWPECKIIRDSSRHPQTQDNVESNQDVENMLRCWMRDNKSTKWSVGCYFVQYYKNSSYHPIIGRSPYRALFGCDPIIKRENIELATSDIQVCLVCGKETEGHVCKSCFKPVHSICGVSSDDEGYGSNILCFLCKNEQGIVNKRKQAHKGVKRVAEKMVDGTAKKLPLLETGEVIDFKKEVYKIETSSENSENCQDRQLSPTDYNEAMLELPISLRQSVT